MQHDTALRVLTAGDPRPAIRTALAEVRYTVLTERTYDELVKATGGLDRAIRWLLALANEYVKPIGVNLEQDGHSQTLFIAPTGWTEQRLKGYVAMAIPHLEQQFGEVSSIAASAAQNGWIEGPARLTNRGIVP